MTSVITEIVIHCQDVEREAVFWAAAIGWEPRREREYTWMSQTGSPAELKLVFDQVPERKTGRNRLHLDVVTRGADQAEEVERLIGLGATRVDIGQGDVPWVVLADPEGNEFCVLRRRID